MKGDNCLNCHEVLTGNYCSKCGQPADTDKLSLKYIFFHDFIHGVFHLDKGVLYSLKELYTRPGHSIREYVQGKRRKHFNYFTLIIVMLLAEKIIGSFSTVEYTAFEATFTKEVMNTLDLLTRKYAKVFILVSIPIQAIISYLFFKKTKENFAAHLVINAYVVGGELVLNILLVIVSIFFTDTQLLATLWMILEFVKVLYTTWFFYQYFSVFEYPKSTLLIKSFLCASMILLILLGIGGILVFL